MSDTKCAVIAIDPLTTVISRVVLKPQSPIAFKAGQYLQVVMGQDDRRPFSIASVPAADMIELHIGAEPGNQYAIEVLERMQQQGEIWVEAGKGNAWFRQGLPKPVILLAGGTGFSYTYSILQQLLADDFQQPLFLYWGTRQQEDLYAFKQLQQLQAKHANFTFVAVVEQAKAGWQGKTGLVHNAVLQDFVSLEPYQVYVAGRFEMAGVVRQAFSERGLQADNLFGDAYEFI